MFLNYSESIVKSHQFQPTSRDLAPPLGVTPFSAKIFSTRKLESLGYHVALLA